MVCAPERRDNPRALAFYLTCTTITSVDLAHYGVSRAKYWVSVDCGTIKHEYVIQLEYVYVIMLSYIRGCIYSFLA